MRLWGHNVSQNTPPMNRVTEYFKHINWQQFFIYFFSFLIYLGLNKLFSNVFLDILGEDSFRERWTNFSIPCGPNVPSMFVVAFEIFKCILFALMIMLSKKAPKGLLSEILTAYFLYDFVYILSFIWGLIPFPIQLPTWWILSSSGQVFLSRFIPYLDLIFAGAWTIALFLFLFQSNRLSLPFLAKRLFVITISVPILFLLIVFCISN